MPARLNFCQRSCIAKVRFTIHASLANPDRSNKRSLNSAAESEIAIRNRSMLNF